MNSKAIIDAGPELGGRDPGLLTSSDLSDLDSCWEKDFLEDKELEWPAIRVDGLYALGLIEKYVQPPGELLDYGCGWGFFLNLARERGWSVHGLEPLPGSALHARARFGIPVITDVLREDTYTENQFDVITAYQVFEHLPDPARVLDIMWRILRPGGLILVEVPNIDTWSVRLLRQHHRHFVQDHLHFFSTTTLARLYENCNIEVVEAHSTARHMTIRHLTAHWGRRYLPEAISTVVERLATRHNNRLVRISTGDIITVIGRKPDCASQEARVDAPDALQAQAG